MNTQKQPGTGEDSPAERAWCLIAGIYDLDHYWPPEADFIHNDWDEDPVCAVLWDNISQAYERLNERLGGKGDICDHDLDYYASDYQSLMGELCKRMFEYGRIYERRHMENIGGA